MSRPEIAPLQDVEETQFGVTNHTNSGRHRGRADDSDIWYHFTAYVRRPRSLAEIWTLEKL
jgi:hypothetical protein